MQTENLQILRFLRTQEKAIKAQIDAIIDAATQEAVAVLAEQGLDRGEFEVPNVGTFQLQRTDIPRSWPVTSRPSNSSTRTNNPTRSN